MTKKLNCFFNIFNQCFDLGLPPNLKSFLQYVGLVGWPLVFMMLGRMSFSRVWPLITRRSKSLPTSVRIYYRPKKINTSSSDMMHFMREIIDRHYVFLLCIIIGTIILTTIVSYKKIKNQRRIHRHQARVNRVAARILSLHRKPTLYSSQEINF